MSDDNKIPKKASEIFFSPLTGEQREELAHGIVSESMRDANRGEPGLFANRARAQNQELEQQQAESSRTTSYVNESTGVKVPENNNSSVKNKSDKRVTHNAEEILAGVRNKRFVETTPGWVSIPWEDEPVRVTDAFGVSKDATVQRMQARLDNAEVESFEDWLRRQLAERDSSD